MPHVPVNGVAPFCDLTGPEGAPVIAFSNSIGTTLEMWDAQARAFSGRCRVLRYDTRGHGRSAVAEQPVTIDDLADDLAGLLDALGVERAHVVGLSLGGMIAQSLAARRPERVAGLVLMLHPRICPPVGRSARRLCVRGGWARSWTRSWRAGSRPSSCKRTRRQLRRCVSGFSRRTRVATPSAAARSGKWTCAEVTSPSPPRH
jgi:pimeloyl-ACP methyl ester carboxylesterase